MIEFSKRVILSAAATWVMALALSGCGGGSGSGSNASQAPPASTKAMVGADGGTVTGPDGVQVVISAGALDAPTEIGISNDGSGATEIGGIKPISKVIAVTPHGTEFAESVRINLPFNPADVGAGGQPVIIKSQPGGTWSALQSEVVGSMVSADISGFSYYAVGTCYTSRDTTVGGPDPLIACPTAHSLKLELLDNSGVALPVLRNSNGVAIPVLTITEPTQLKFAVTYRRPPSGRLDHISVVAPGVRSLGWPVNSSFGGPTYPPDLAGYQTDLTFDANPSAIVDASRPGGKVIRFEAYVTTQMDAFYLGCLCFKPASWTYVAEVPVRVIYTAPITPPPPPVATYTVGGTVSGLTGTGLVLRNNGAGNLAVASGANAFSFPAPVNAGSAYAVTVLTQPAGQTCTMQNGSGTATANVSTVAVSCVVVVAGPKAWQGAALLETLDVGEALEPQVAFDASGNGMAIWQQVSGGRYHIFARRYVPNSGWGSVVQVSTTNPSVTINYGAPQVAFGLSGNAIAVFSACDPDRCGISTAQFTAASSSWSSETQLAAIGVDAQIAIDANGNAMALWTAFNGSYQDITSRRYEASSSTWQTPRILSADVGGSSPRIAFDGSGNAIAIWRSQESSTAVNQHLVGDRYVAGSGWNPQGLFTTIATFGAGASRAHQLAVDAAGNATAVWAQFETGSQYESIYSSRFSGNNWSTPAAVESSAINTASPIVVMGGANGNAIVFWYEFDQVDGYITWARRYVAGVGGTATRIDSGVSISSLSLKASMDAAGNAVAVWTQGSSIWANRYVANTGWAGATVIDDTNGGRSDNPAVAVDANGNAIAVWSKSGNQVPTNIWANVFR